MMPRQADMLLLGDELPPLFELPEGHAEDLLSRPIVHSECRPEFLPGDSLLQGKPFMIPLQFPDDPRLQAGIDRSGQDPRLFTVDKHGTPCRKHPLQASAEFGPADTCPNHKAGFRNPADPGPRQHDGQLLDLILRRKEAGIPPAPLAQIACVSRIGDRGSPRPQPS